MTDAEIKRVAYLRGYESATREIETYLMRRDPGKHNDQVHDFIQELLQVTYHMRHSNDQ